jgi:Arabidopsis protein of unknown function
VLKAEEELNKARAFVRSSSLTYEIILDAIKTAGHVYECINDLCMSSDQNSLTQWQQRRWIDQELEESVRLLDICSTSREKLDSMRSYIQNQESAIRRGESKATKSCVTDFTNLVKKACKDVKKHVSKKNGSFDGGSFTCASLIMEAKELAFFLLQAVFASLLEHIAKRKCSNWSLASKLLHKRTATYNEEKGDDVLDIVSFFGNVEGLDSGLEFLFRHAIQCRVSLLNLCSL